VPWNLAAVPPTNEWELVGRTERLAILRRALIEEGRTRIAIHGKPGVGKTALAAALAADEIIKRHFSDGVLWVAVGKQAEPLTILGKWCEAVGVGSAVRSLTRAEDRGNLLRGSIVGRALLFIADDVWSRADAETLARAIGERHPLVVTTRQTEVACAYSSRGKPLEELTPQQGLQLLELLAPGIAEQEPVQSQALVDVVGGLPLALSLVAKYLQAPVHSHQPGRVSKALRAVREALESLRGGGATPRAGLPMFIPEKLRGVFHASYAALNAHAQRAMRSLWVFPPKPHTFSQEAAIHVAGRGIPDQAIYDLADFGLLENCGGDRYAIHQMTADYAAGLEVVDSARREFVEYFMKYLRENTSRYERLYAECHNLLRGLQFATELRLRTKLIDGVNAMFPFLEARGLYTQSQVSGYLKSAEFMAGRIAESPRGGPTDLIRYASVVHGLARVAEKCADYDEAQRRLHEALRIARKACDDRLIGEVLLTFGIVENNLTKYRHARHLLRIALRRVTRAPARGCRRFSRNGETSAAQQLALASRIRQRLGDVAFNQGNLDEAEIQNAAGLELAMQTDDPERVSALRLNRAVVMIERGMCEQARVELRSALRLAWRIKHLERICGILHAYGVLSIRCKAFDQADGYLREGLQYARDIKHSWYICTIHNELGELHLAQGLLPEARAAFEQATAYATAADLSAHAEFGLARWRSSCGELSVAKEQAGKALKVLAEIGHRRVQAVEGWLRSLSTAPIANTLAEGVSQAVATQAGIDQRFVPGSREKEMGSSSQNVSVAVASPG
jgi:tetratricopeptide (TPR) repeat protein